jgi:predicted metal-dependent phosphoesterase TrpH
MAQRLGIGVAITDHDECRGMDEVAGTDFGVPVLAGIELAARFEGNSVHVLGLGVNWKDKGLVGHITWARDARRRRAALILEKLRAGGMDISMGDLRFQGDVVSRSHIATALVNKGYAADPKDAFARYLSYHTPYYVPYEKISAQDAAALIRAAGGLPVLAHPGEMAPGAWECILPSLEAMGFWGVEAYHPSHTDGQCREFESLSRAKGLYVTAGSDFHGRVKPEVALGQETRGGAYLAQSMKALVSGISI